jgi:hypothetical protein
MISVDTPSDQPIPSSDEGITSKSDPATPLAGDRPSSDDFAVPHYLVVLLFQDGRSADLVVPGVTGMGGSGDAEGPGRLSIYSPHDGSCGTRRLVSARLFSDLADLAVVTEPLELEINEAP